MLEGLPAKKVHEGLRKCPDNGMVSRSVALGDVALVLEEPAVNLAVEGLLNRCGMPGGVRDQGGGFWHALS